MVSWKRWSEKTKKEAGVVLVNSTGIMYEMSQKVGIAKEV
jgi:hypothetical protein